MKACLFMAAIVAVSVGCGPKPPPAGRNVTATPIPAATTMNNSNAGNEIGSFMSHLPAAFEMPKDDVGNRLLKEYGALFVAHGVAVPNVVVFNDAASVSAFQASTGSTAEMIGGLRIELQEPAMHALKEAAGEAAASGLTITPRGSDSARRSYDDTVSLWASRVEPGLDHWAASGRISADDERRIRSLSPFDQVPEIFKLEDKGIFFSKDFSKSIIYSVAPPGASQHLSMLALDVSEFDDPNVRAILAKHGWFQTVVSDLPHFTYLGAAETDLPALGLKRIMSGDRAFWVPDLGPR